MNNLSIRSILLTILLFTFSNNALSQSDRSHCDLGFGWHFYCDEAASEETSQENKEEDEMQQYRTKLEDMQKELEDKKIRAVVDPTPEHIEEYMAYQNKMLDQSSEFTDVWRRVVWGSPELDYSLKVPTNTMAKHRWIDEKNENISKVLKNLNERYGLFFIYRSDCPYCHKYSPVIRSFGEAYDIDIVPITIDDKFIEGWENSTITDLSAVKRMGIEITKVPATILYDNKEKKVIPVGFGILSKSDLEKRIYTLTTLKINEGF